MYDTGLSIINCHLSSGQDEGDCLKRHSDCEEILRRWYYPHEGQNTDLEVFFAESTPEQVCLHVSHIVTTAYLPSL